MQKFYLLAILVLTGSCHNTSQKQVPQKEDTLVRSSDVVFTPSKKLTATEFIDKIEGLGYFAYADNKNVPVVKKTIKNHFTGDKEFMTEFQAKYPFQSLDLRFYSCGDGEELYEEGGVVALLEEMKPLFNKLRVPLNYSNDSYFGNSHSIVLNNKSYTLATGGPLMWGETIAKYAEMINYELAKYNKRERLYILTNENYYMVLLTQELYELIGQYFKTDKSPATVEEWVTQTQNELQRLLN